MEIVFEHDKYGLDHIDRNGSDGKQMYFVWFRARQGETEYVCFIRENALTDSFGATLDEKNLLSTFEQNRSLIEGTARQKITQGIIASAKTTPWSTGKEVWLRRPDFPGEEDHVILAARSLTAAQEKVLAMVPLLERGDVAGVQEAIKSAARMISYAATRLRSAGVPQKFFDTGAPETSAAPSFALAEMALLDSSDIRALLAGVKALVPLAEKIDKSRGNWYPEYVGRVTDQDAPGTDTTGTNYAESLHNLVARLDLEVNGPKSRK